MDDFFSRFWEELVGRASGPFAFRFILQPVMAMVYATRDGLRDARAGRPPYFWGIFTRPGERLELLREGTAAVGRVIALGIVMDLAYQIIVFRAIRPLEMIVIGFVLAFAPYLLLRGPINRIARAWMHRNRTPA